MAESVDTSLMQFFDMLNQKNTYIAKKIQLSHVQFGKLYRKNNIISLNLNGIRRKEANIGYYMRRGVCAHVIECLSRRSGD